MEKINITTEYIKLDQFLKWIGASDNGAQAKMMIADGKILVNGIVEKQRGKKIRSGDVIKVGNDSYIVE